MQRITAESEIEDVMQQIGVGSGENLNESEKRRRNLEKFAQLRARNPNTELKLAETETAFVEANEESKDGKFLNITITTREFPQTVYDLPQEYHNYLIQKGMTIHEAAHIMYSSYPAFQKYLDKVEQEAEDKSTVTIFQNIVNALEDGAIEKFAQDDYNVHEELLHLRATLHENNSIGREVDMGDAVEYHYPMYHALMTAIMNIGVYDNGNLRKLLDDDNRTHRMAFRGGELNKEIELTKEMLVDVLPDIRQYIFDIQSERNAEKRMGLCYELWKELKKLIDRSTTPGKSEAERENEAREQDSYRDGVPANIGEAHGEQKKTPSGGNEGDSEENAAPNDTLGDERKEGVEKRKSEIEEQANEQAEKDIIEETKQESGDWSDELEEIITSLGAGDGTDEIYIADDNEVDTVRKREAERHGKRCAKVFRTRLQRLQKDKEVSRKRRGTFDSRRMVEAERGTSKVFKQTREGDNKDYSCIIVCDRSGSMNSRIDDVELSAGAVATGLEEVGVDVSILDTYSSKTALAKPFGSTVDNFEEKLFAGRTGGGTPIRHTVSFAKERMERGQGKFPFMIVITDGRPSSREEFKEEIKTANFPVIGFYLTNSEEDEQLKLYDRAITVSSDDSVTGQLMNLINSIMF